MLYHIDKVSLAQWDWRLGTGGDSLVEASAGRFLDDVREVTAGIVLRGLCESFQIDVFTAWAFAQLHAEYIVPCLEIRNDT